MLIWFWLNVSLAKAQEPHFLSHTNQEMSEGNPIHTMLQDHHCMLWLGTSTGLSRYDGTIWHEITLEHPDSIYQVTAIFEDRDFNIWIGTSSGKIFYLDPVRKVHDFDVDEGHPAKSITSIIQDPNGFIWFSTYGEGAYVYTGSRVFNFDMDDGLSGNDIYTMICRPNGDVWLGTDDGISICTFKNETKSIQTIGLDDGLPDQIITSLHTDKAGNVWIGTFEFGVAYFDASSGSISRPFGQVALDEITAFTLFDDHEIWIGTRSSGVWRYSPDQKFPRRLDGLYKISRGSTTDLLVDVEGNIWVSSDEGQLLSAFRPFESLQVNTPEIQAVFADSKNQVWVGTQNGLFRAQEYPSSTSDVINVLPDLPLNITDIMEDAFGQLWIGTIDKGLYIYHPATQRVRHIGSIIDQGGYTIMSMAAAKDVLWLATLEGVVSYPADKNILTDQQIKFTLLRDPWQSYLHFVYHVFVDSKNRTWFATDGNGLFYSDGPMVHQLKPENGELLNTVYSICEDRNGHFWFTVPEIGIVKYDGAILTVISPKEGLSSVDIASIHTAGNGSILITHDKGMDVMEPDGNHFMYYGTEIGIKGMEPGLNAGSVNAGGHVYTSGRNVILKYYAPRQTLSIHPRTQITTVKNFDKEVDFNVEHRFSHARNYFTFVYTGLWYTSPGAVKYQYKLEGYDLQWKESRDTEASYSNLPPGDYTFSVKASENKFFLDEPMATYSFVVEKPFWRQYWFIALMATAGFALLFWLIKVREQRSERRAIDKKDKIESQLATLKAQINPHFLFNSFNTLITVIDENPMQPAIAIEYVEKLSDFYRSILLYREQESISLEEEWSLVHTYLYLLEKRYGQNLRLHMDDPPTDGYIVPLTLQMLVENAVKHNVISEKYPLDIFISHDNDDYVTVKNTLQPKSKPEPSTQFGLDSIVRRYQLLTSQPVIIEEKERSFIVRIPVINKSAS